MHLLCCSRIALTRHHLCNTLVVVHSTVQGVLCFCGRVPAVSSYNLLSKANAVVHAVSYLTAICCRLSAVLVS